MPDGGFGVGAIDGRGVAAIFQLEFDLSAGGSGAGAAVDCRAATVAGISQRYGRQNRPAQRVAVDVDPGRNCVWHQAYGWNGRRLGRRFGAVGWVGVRRFVRASAAAA
ncbi:hypothetical protein D9M71_750090 [compost metagenome]